MRFTQIFVIAAIPFLASAYPSPDVSSDLHPHSLGTRDLIFARMDRVKTHDDKSTNYEQKNSDNPKARHKAGEQVATEAMQQGAAGPAGMQQNANIRANPHGGGSQANNPATVATAQQGDQQSTTHHFGAQYDSKGNAHWDGTDHAFTNQNSGSTSAYKPQSKKHWDGPDQPKKRAVYARSADPWAMAYADAYADAFAIHARGLGLEI